MDSWLLLIVLGMACTGFALITSITLDSVISLKTKHLLKRAESTEAGQAILVVGLFLIISIFLGLRIPINLRALFLLPERSPLVRSIPAVTPTLGTFTPEDIHITIFMAPRIIVVIANSDKPKKLDISNIKFETNKGEFYLKDVVGENELRMSSNSICIAFGEINHYYLTSANPFISRYCNKSTEFVPWEFNGFWDDAESPSAAIIQVNQRPPIYCPFTEIYHGSSSCNFAADIVLGPAFTDQIVPLTATPTSGS
jgi:hypothetical protein